MAYPTDYNPDGAHPWQREPDDKKALRLFIDSVSRQYPVRDAWVVVATGDGQQLTAFSHETRAGAFALELAAGKGAHPGVAFSDLLEGQVRVAVNRVSWPEGCKLATVVSYLNDADGEDYILAIPPVPAIAYGDGTFDFRGYAIGGPDNLEGGYVSVLELDGETQEGGW